MSADYLAFSGSHSVSLHKGAASLFLPSAAAATFTVQFRTTAAASRALIWIDTRYGAGTQVEYWLDINGSGAGRVRVGWWDGGGTFGSQGTAGSLADGAWHTASVVRASPSLMRLYVDGAQVGADVTASVGTGSLAGYRALGRNPDGSAALPFTGDIRLAVAHARALSLAEHQAIHAGGSVLAPGGDLVAYPCGPAAADDYDRDHLRGWGCPLADRSASTLGTYPVATAGDGTVAGLAATDPSGAVVFARAARLIDPGTTDAGIREIGNSYQLPDGRWAIVYTGHTAGNVNQPQVHLATSADGGATWSKSGVILDRAACGIYTEDPYVLPYPWGGRYWLYCENRGGAGTAIQDGIALFSSADGETGWTLEDAHVLANLATGWESQDCSSPIVRHDAGTGFTMLYEGRSSDTVGAMGVATATSPAGPWTRSPSNPVFSAAPGQWDGGAVVVDDYVLIGGAYYLTYHGATTTDFRCGVASATSPTGTWTRLAGNPATDTYCSTLMIARWRSGGRSLYGLQESGTAAGSILRYDLYGSAPAGTPDYGPPSSSWPASLLCHL